jgi:hypothetical protein
MVVERTIIIIQEDGGGVEVQDVVTLPGMMEVSPRGGKRRFPFASNSGNI